MLSKRICATALLYMAFSMPIVRVSANVTTEHYPIPKISAPQECRSDSQTVSGWEISIAKDATPTEMKRKPP
jgi:hypothetical protein